MKGYDRAANAANQRARRARVKDSQASAASARQQARTISAARALIAHLRGALDGVRDAPGLVEAQTIATAALELLPGGEP